MNEKDRLGKKLHEKEHAEENAYFAARDRELIAKLRDQHEVEQERTIQELARGRCPRCGVRLDTHSLQEVEIDECPGCNGLWLDAGEFETLSRTKGQLWAGRFLDGLRRLLSGPAG